MRRTHWIATVVASAASLVLATGGPAVGAVAEAQPAAAQPAAAQPEAAQPASGHLEGDADGRGFRPHASFGTQGVDSYGDAADLGGPGGSPVAAPVVAMAATPDGNGYWVAAADGGVFTYGDAGFYGSLGAGAIYAPIVGIAATPDGRGYWMVAMDGGVFTFGDAGYYGSLGATRLAASIVGMAPTPDGHGYWLVGADGGVFTFGDADYLGSMGGQHLDAPVVGLAATADGAGYWLVGQDGGVFTYGDAGYFGSAANADIGAGVAQLVPTPDGEGYWMVADTGGVLTFGDAPFEGPDPNPPPFSPAVGMAATPDGQGYWILRQDEERNTFASPGPSSARGAHIVSVAAGQIGADPDSGAYCNPYGPCEEWCALFATWVWQQAGIAVPSYAFTGLVYGWGQQYGRIIPPSDVPAPGDAVLYGTGPYSTSSSVHMGIVAQVWPDGAIDTVEGDAGPEPEGHYAVVVNGPFLPSESNAYNGFPVYAFVAP